MSIKNEKRGLYHNDYSPRYKEPYNIYDKAREHMKKQKRVYTELDKCIKNEPEDEKLALNQEDC